MKLNKSIILAGTALAGLVFTTGAFAQSTGTEATESTTVVVTGKRGPKTINGALTKENISKSRSTITQEFIAKQAPGQSILQTINLVPGVNFTNNDPYGSSGGNIRIRGFDGPRISLTFDGAPLNDTGNYAIYSNQQLDPELIDSASVNQGTTDVDSPTASAAGGTVAYKVVKPTNDFGITADASVGSFDYKRAFVMLNTGDIAGTGITSYVAISKTKYDKFKGPGTIDKTQYNGMISKGFGDQGDYVSLAVNWNKNRNYNYRALTLTEFATNPALDYDKTCVVPKGVKGIPQPASSCSNYYGQRVNPSDTGSLRGKFKYHINDGLVFTFDPTFQYVLANGGTQTENVRETDSRLDLTGTYPKGDLTGTGVDLNGDGDVLDTVTLWRPSTTNTHRLTVNTSLIWDVNDDNRFRVAYTLDYGRHRQTGAFGHLTASGDPVDVFGGRDNKANAIFSTDGQYLQNRNRFSIAKLEQYSFEYRGKFIEDKLVLNIGVRSPVLSRELNNYCYQPSGGDFPRCTSEAPSATATPSGNVTIPTAGTAAGSTNADQPYIPPISFTKEYKKVLPNVGISYAVTDSQMLYASYAEQLSAPRTDNLYKYRRDAAAGSPLVTTLVDPETTQSFDLGYRFQNSKILASTALWYTKFHNRIVNTYDPETLQSNDRNVGDVNQYGWDGQIGWQATSSLSIYGSASYNHSELLNDLQLTATTYAPTKGKKIVETPDWTYGSRVQWDVNPDFHLGLQGKYVGKRFITDVNDKAVDAYTVVDLDASWDIEPFGHKDTVLQINVTNLFDEVYLGSLGSTINFNDLKDSTGKVYRAGVTNTTHFVGAPRTAMLTLKTKF